MGTNLTIFPCTKPNENSLFLTETKAQSPSRKILLVGQVRLRTKMIIEFRLALGLDMYDKVWDQF